MKEVIILVRPKMYFKTKKALTEVGFSAMSVKEVLGRGKKPVHYDMDGDERGVKRRLAAKKMLDMYVRDEDVEFLIDTVIGVNKTNSPGDGKIFVLPVNDGIRIRTNEKGNESIL